MRQVRSCVVAVVLCLCSLSAFAASDGGASAAASNAQFSFDFYAKYRANDGNIFFSPYSIFSALSMTAEGARDATQQEMRDVLCISEDPETARVSFRDLYRSINGSDALAMPRSFELHTVNALWVEQSRPILNDYVSLVAENYGGAAMNVDFIANPEAARVTINDWVAQQTAQKIKELLAPRMVNTDTRLVLTNAVYFKAPWEHAFEKRSTKTGDFKTATGTVRVPMMTTELHADYGETDDWQILKLPYEGRAVSMLLFLPKNGNLSAAELTLEPKTLSQLSAVVSSVTVDVTMPKFKAEASYQLSEDLIRMGMPTPFSPDNADFSGITLGEKLFVGLVVHKAFIDVDENGTEAAAATAVMMMDGGAMPKPQEHKVFKVDHPFVFFIVDNETGCILFMGRIADPTKSA